MKQQARFSKIFFLFLANGTCDVINGVDTKQCNNNNRQHVVKKNQAIQDENQVFKSTHTQD